MCKDVESDEISILNQERNLFTTLGTQSEILETYLSLTPHKYLHPNCENIKNLKSIPIRIILSEIVYNGTELRLISSLSGLISAIPLTAFNEKKFTFRAYIAHYSSSAYCIMCNTSTTGTN